MMEKTEFKENNDNPMQLSDQLKECKSNNSCQKKLNNVNIPMNNNNNNNSINGKSEQCPIIMDKTKKFLSTQYCEGCYLPIIDPEFLLGNGKSWHNNCLRCVHCNVVLCSIGSTYFVKHNKNFCRIDYAKFFGSSGICHKCHLDIAPHELIMRCQFRVYHINCFVCTHCKCRLQTGSRYALCNENLFCEMDYYSQFLFFSQTADDESQYNLTAKTKLAVRKKRLSTNTVRTNALVNECD